jgi:hypothetical protein
MAEGKDEHYTSEAEGSKLRHRFSHPPGEIGAIFAETTSRGNLGLILPLQPGTDFLSLTIAFPALLPTKGFYRPISFPWISRSLVEDLTSENRRKKGPKLTITPPFNI